MKDTLIDDISEIASHKCPLPYQCILAAISKDKLPKGPMMSPLWQHPTALSPHIQTYRPHQFEILSHYNENNDLQRPSSVITVAEMDFHMKQCF